MTRSAGLIQPVDTCVLGAPAPQSRRTRYAPASPSRACAARCAASTLESSRGSLILCTDPSAFRWLWRLVLPLGCCQRVGHRVEFGVLHLLHFLLVHLVQLLELAVGDARELGPQEALGHAQHLGRLAQSVHLAGERLVAHVAPADLALVVVLDLLAEVQRHEAE